MGCICSCLKQTSVAPASRHNSRVLVSSSEAQPTIHKTKIEALTVVDNQSSSMMAKKIGEGELNSPNKGTPISSFDMPRKSLSSVSQNQPGTPKRLRDVMYPEPNCRVIVRTLPRKAKPDAPAFEDLVMTAGKATISIPGTTLVGLQSIESFDKLALTKKQSSRRGSKKPAAKQQGDADFAIDQDARSERPRRRSALTKKLKDLPVEDQPRSLRSVFKRRSDDEERLKVLRDEPKSVPKKEYKSQSHDLAQEQHTSERKIIKNHNPTSNEHLALRETSEIKLSSNFVGLQHQKSLNLFTGSYWKDTPAFTGPDAQPHSQNLSLAESAKVAGQLEEQEHQAKYTNTVSLYPESPDFPDYLKNEESLTKKGQTCDITANKDTAEQQTGLVAPQPIRLVTQPLESFQEVTQYGNEHSQLTGRFGLETMLQSRHLGIHSSIATADIHQSTSVQNVTFMQGPLAESGASHGQPATSHFSFQLKTVD